MPATRRCMPSHPQPERAEELITFVTDRPGHDRRYAIDALQDQARTWLEGGQNVENRT